MGTNFSNTSRHQSHRGPFARLAGAFRNVRNRDAETTAARYFAGRWTDAAEREMTEKLLHLDDQFRF